ncbi:hypothetical protein L211DRAFT_444688 [Terfezia boudieri ATCC MYA-4762]|uniref:Secreted protein n=1 Tax=Terfezia boudieri ATCC MYA-4762 TaxID=1051890 RepID=A0A3N4LER2_9PEZI|nr:hypothetical protein L211DRAFT_444688 [Terfezia boudieri ATCC MYA-4762]
MFNNSSLSNFLFISSCSLFFFIFPSCSFCASSVSRLNSSISSGSSSSVNLLSCRGGLPSAPLLPGTPQPAPETTLGLAIRAPTSTEDLYQNTLTNLGILEYWCWRIIRLLSIFPLLEFHCSKFWTTTSVEIRLL